MKKVKLLTAALLGALMMCLLVPAAAQAKVYHETFRLAKGSPANLVTEDGKTYYEVDGERITDRIVDFGKKATCATSYYFGEDGAMVKKQRIYYKGDYLYAGGKGKLQKNKWIKGKYYDKEGYYIPNRFKTMPKNPSSGVYQIGKKSVKCYLYERGQRVTSQGFHYSDSTGCVYYVKSNGQAAVNTWINDSSYYFNDLYAETFSHHAPFYFDRNGEYNPRYSKKASTQFLVYRGSYDYVYSEQTTVARQWECYLTPTNGVGYYQWYKLYGNGLGEELRQIERITEKTMVKFGLDANDTSDNVWCIRVWGCKRTKKAATK